MHCSICSGVLESIGTIPFDRNNSNVPIVNNTPTEYFRCKECAFICCPEMLQWSSEKLGQEVYNEDYIKYDPEYLDIRPKNSANFLMQTVNRFYYKKLHHLDYGSGMGVMSKELRKHGWNSTAYDPYSNPIRPDRKFDFITAVEVFEHSSNIDKTIKDIKSLLSRNGVILFTTLFGNSKTTIDWWYIGARNGHIGILSEKSMKILAKNNNLFFSSIGENTHILQDARSNIKGILGW